jgi:phage terminase large subunit-like protein
MLSDSSKPSLGRLPSLEAIRAELARREAERVNGLPEWDWRRKARPEQLPPPGDWLIWLTLAGRGWGKTRAAVEFVNGEVEAGRARRIAIVAENADDARNVIAEGPSGFVNVGPPNKRPVYEPSKDRLTWPNGAIATLYSAQAPGSLRGPEHDLAYCDELAKWSFAKPGDPRKSSLGQETWDNLQFGLRQGSARCIVTTTPRPVPLIKELMRSPRTHVTRGHTEENAANLSSDFLGKMRLKYAGTRLGRQELRGELLEDIPGALWTPAMFDASGFRVAKPPDLVRVVIAIDPSGARGADDEGADSIGIVAAGRGIDGRAYLLADATCRLGPSGWARRAVDLYHRLRADRIIGERNFGGAMVESTVRNVDPNVAYMETTATSGRGKAVRAEPAAALYEQGRVSHVGAVEDWELLEAQQCAMTTSGYIGEGSPDRVDAAVWALDELMGLSAPEDFLPYWQAQIVKAPATVPELPWHEAQAVPADDGDLIAVYDRARARHQGAPPTCKRCGKPVGASRITDGVDFWHAECR